MTSYNSKKALLKELPQIQFPQLAVIDFINILRWEAKARIIIEQVHNRHLLR